MPVVGLYHCNIKSFSNISKSIIKLNKVLNLYQVISFQFRFQNCSYCVIYTLHNDKAGVNLGRYHSVYCPCIMLHVEQNLIINYINKYSKIICALTSFRKQAAEILFLVSTIWVSVQSPSSSKKVHFISALVTCNMLISIY